MGRGYVTSSHPRTQQVTLLEGSTVLRGHDDLAPEPVLPPQDAHLLNGHSLGLRQEEDDVDGHAEHPEGEEDVGAVLHPASMVKRPTESRLSNSMHVRVRDVNSAVEREVECIRTVSLTVLFCLQLQAGTNSVTSSGSCAHWQLVLVYPTYKQFNSQRTAQQDKRSVFCIGKRCHA